MESLFAIVVFLQVGISVALAVRAAPFVSAAGEHQAIHCRHAVGGAGFENQKPRI
jgi:hypothetical protein